MHGVLRVEGSRFVVEVPVRINTDGFNQVSTLFFGKTPMQFRLRPVWECRIDRLGWSLRFHGTVPREVVVAALKLEVEDLRREADTLAATPDEPGSWVGGGPSNGELADGLRMRADDIEASLPKIESGEIEPQWYPCRNVMEVR